MMEAMLTGSLVGGELFVERHRLDGWSDIMDTQDLGTSLEG